MDDAALRAALGRLVEEELAKRTQSRANEGDNPTLRDFIDEYSLHAKVHVKAFAKTYKAKLGHVARLLGHIRVMDLKEVDVIRYTQAREKEPITFPWQTRPSKQPKYPAPGSIALEMRLLVVAINWGVRTRRLPNSPISNLKIPTVDNARQTHLTETEQIEFLRACNPTFRLMLALMFETGMRKSECRKLKWEEVDLNLRLIRLEARRNKGKRAREIPLTDRALEVLSRVPRHVKSDYVFFCPDTGRAPLSDSRLQCWLVRARKVSGMRGKDGEKIVIHTARHSWATAALRGGLAWPYVKAVGGWATDAVAQRYQHIDAETIEAIRASLNRRGALPVPDAEIVGGEDGAR